MSIPCICQRVTRDRQGDVPFVLACGIVANPAQAIVREPRRAAAPLGDLVGRVVVDPDLQLRRIPANDLRQFGDRIKVEMLAELKTDRGAARKSARSASSPRSA